MQKFSFLILLFSFTCLQVSAQSSEGRKLPIVNVKNLKGETVSTATIRNEGKPMVISFWATWCKPCINELINISDVYEDWQKETGVKLVAVSIDDSRNTAKVGPLVNAKGWDYEVLLDPNQDFKRAMNVNNIPHTFLLDGEGNIVYQHNSYTEGDEISLYKMIRKSLAGEEMH